MKYENETEEILLRYLDDLKILDFSFDQAKSLLDKLAYPDQYADWAAGQACAVCPPPEARKEFYNYIYDEIQNLYCNHDDSAIPIAEYIVDEIKTNTKSKHADKIRHELSLYSNKNNDPNAFVMGNTGAVLGSKIIANYSFADIIGDKRPWDHKPIIREKFKDKGVNRPIGFDGNGNFYKTFYTKYKNYDYFYDVWSNIHYGYVGMSLGLSEDDLTLGSNIQQFFHDIVKLEFNFGDTGSDKATILIGINLYKKFGKYAESLTAQDVLDALDKDEILQTSLDQEPKQTHWCWHSKNKQPKKRRDKE
ncbi:polymorphic toxin type 44 domain-containing protein [Providencia stuartii]